MTRQSEKLLKTTHWEMVVRQEDEGNREGEIDLRHFVSRHMTLLTAKCTVQHRPT